MKRTLGLLVLCFVLIQGTTGCNYADNRDPIPSTFMQPTTASIEYRPSGETAWTYPIPPNHKLVLDFDTEGAGPEFFYASQGPATTVSWELYPLDATPSLIFRSRFHGSPVDSGSMTLTGDHVLRTTVGEPIDPSTIPSERTEDEIRQELEDLPEPDAAAEEEATEDAAE